MESPGLTSDEASARLAQSGPNAMPDTETPLWRLALAKFWAPVPLGRQPELTRVGSPKVDHLG